MTGTCWIKSGRVVKNYRYRSFNSIYRLSNMTFIPHLRWIQESINGDPLKYYYRTINSMGKKIEYKYIRFRYDEWGNTIYLLHHTKNIRNKKSHIEITMKYDGKDIIYYKDQDGNEWRKEWGIDLPFNSADELIHDALFLVVTNKASIITEEGKHKRRIQSLSYMNLI